MERRGRYEWVYEECAELGDIERYRSDERRAFLRIPGATRMSRRELGILNEIVKLRERVARERDLPVRYILPDDVVGGLGGAQAGKRSRISRSSAASTAGMKRQLGPAILQAVARGQALDEADLPQRPAAIHGAGARRDRRAARRGDRGDRARRVAAGQACSCRAPRSSASLATFRRIARRFERVLALQPWRLALVAEPLWRLLSGEAALADRRLRGRRSQSTTDP